MVLFFNPLSLRTRPSASPLNVSPTAAALGGNVAEMAPVWTSLIPPIPTSGTCWHIKLPLFFTLFQVFWSCYKFLCEVHSGRGQEPRKGLRSASSVEAVRPGLPRADPAPWSKDSVGRRSAQLPNAVPRGLQRLQHRNPGRCGAIPVPLLKL